MLVFRKPANPIAVSSSILDLLCIYVDSFIFILGSVILQYAFDPKNDKHWCAAATLLCICGYLTGKVCIPLLRRHWGRTG